MPVLHYISSFEVNSYKKLQDTASSSFPIPYPLNSQNLPSLTKVFVDAPLQITRYLFCQKFVKFIKIYEILQNL